MKEQVITPRMSPRNTAAGKGRGGASVQKPARRERGATVARGGRLRKVLVYLPLIGKVTLAVLVGVLLFAGYRAAASASFFELHAVDLNATTRADADQIKRVVNRATAQTGVWEADLANISAELERLPWVRKAVVTRVLPDGLRVRVTERAPLAVVRTSGGKFVWVDEDAVTLDAMTATDRMPTFFIRGWDEAGTQEAQADNRVRIRKYLELLKAWDAAGLSERVSEVDLADLRNVRVQLAGDDSEIEVRFLEEKNVSGRLKPALDELDAKRNTTCGPFINYLIVKPNSNLIIGKAPGAPPLCEGNTSSGPAVVEAERSKDSASAVKADKPPRKAKEANDKASRQDKEQRAKKDRDKKEEAKNRAKGESRPRRVG